jgi:sugar phosphate permease
LDLRLIPWLSLLYLAAFLDRTNVGNAKIEGLQQALHMTNNQYNATLTIFFVSYAVFEPLTNVLLKRTTPKYFIAAIIIIWVSRMNLVMAFSNACKADPIFDVGREYV